LAKRGEGRFSELCLFNYETLNKLLANKKDVPYQSLLKMFLSEMIEEELHAAAK
jgi:hypothetical protein